MKSGAELMREIDACRTAPGELAFWRLGQMSVVLKTGGRVFYVDLYLKPGPRRKIPPLLDAESIANADFICGTHDHSDHIDRTVWPALSKASPRARFVAPAVLVPVLARDLGIPESRFVGLDDRRWAICDGVKITGVAAAHEQLAPDPASGRFAFLSYVIEADGVTVFHAGDTCRYEGQETRLKGWTFDAAFLPINGRDARRLARNCIGNMTYQEAADLAGALRPRLTVPGHHDLFADNAGDPEAFRDYMRVKYPDLAVGLSAPGECVRLPPR
jgi:L-ascorbate metabolism protein UlaG (beta-lactamase superfamily)